MWRKHAILFVFNSVQHITDWLTQSTSSPLMRQNHVGVSKYFMQIVIELSENWSCCRDLQNLLIHFCLLQSHIYRHLSEHAVILSKPKHFQEAFISECM